MIHPDLGLRQAANAPASALFSWHQSVTITLDGQDIAGAAELRLEATGGTGKFYPGSEIAGRIEQTWSIVGSGELQPLPVTIRPQSPHDWTIKASLSSGGIDGGGMYLLVHFNDIVQGQLAPTSYTRVSIRGQNIWDMPPYVTDPQPTGWWRRPNAHVTAFGRPAIIAQLHPRKVNADTEQSQCIVGFTYSGLRLHKNELRAVCLLLDLFNGNRGQIAGEEGFDDNGNRLWHQAYSRARYSTGRQSLFAPGADTQALFDQFEPLAARIHHVMFGSPNPVQIDAIQHQLFAGDENGYPELALGQYAIALDALTNMAVSQYGPFERKAMDEKAYNNLVAPVLELISKQFDAYPEARDALLNRANSANDRSVERTRKIFWSEIVGWKLSKEQRKLLDLRSAPIHLAHVPSARSADGFRDIEQKSRRFRNVFTEAYLRYLRYVGGMNDAANPGQTLNIPATNPAPGSTQP